jgi:hypothetical protein
MADPRTPSAPSPTFDVKPHPAGGYVLTESPTGLPLKAAFHKACDLAGWGRP